MQATGWYISNLNVAEPLGWGEGRMKSQTQQVSQVL